jgi:hypothetical protein
MMRISTLLFCLLVTAKVVLAGSSDQLVLVSVGSPTGERRFDVLSNDKYRYALALCKAENSLLPIAYARMQKEWESSKKKKAFPLQRPRPWLVRSIGFFRDQASAEAKQTQYANREAKRVAREKDKREKLIELNNDKMREKMRADDAELAKLMKLLLAELEVVKKEVMSGKLPEDEGRLGQGITRMFDGIESMLGGEITPLKPAEGVVRIGE